MSYGIEFDPDKDEINRKKHGFSLAEFSEIDFTGALIVEDKRFEYGEDRFLMLAPLRGRLCAVAFTMKGEIYRVISLRKANERERKKYHDKSN